MLCGTRSDARDNGTHDPQHTKSLGLPPYHSTRCQLSAVRSHGNIPSEPVPNSPITTDNGPLTTDKSLRVALMILGLTLLTALVYWPVHAFGFIDYDDPDYLLANPHIRQGITRAGIKDAFCKSHFANYSPLLSLSFELDQNLFGLQPHPMHDENVLLHLLAGLLFWRLLLVTTGELNLGFAVAALFLCHPMHVESVAWVAERKDVLSTSLLLLAMLFYVRFCRASPGPRRWLLNAAVVLLFLFSLMVKTMGVTLPAVLLLLDFWPLRRWPAKSFLSLAIEKIPLGLAAIAFSILQYFALTQLNSVVSLSTLSLGDRISNAIVCCVIYIVKLAVPTDLAVFYPHPGSRPMAAVVASAGLLACITIVCWRLRRRWPFAWMGWLWFVVTLLPVINLVQIGSHAMADRYSYLPSVGLLIAVVWGIARMVSSGAVRSIMLASVVVIFSIMAHHQVWYWQSTEVLFTHAVEVTGDNPVADVELGFTALQRGDLKRAVDEYTRAGANPHAFSGLGNCWRVDNPQKAIGYYRKALAMRPTDPVYMVQLADALRSTGQLDEARKLAESAVAADPDSPDPRDELARIVALQQGATHGR